MQGDTTADIRELVDDVLTSGQALVDFSRSQGPDSLWVSGGEVHARWNGARARLDARLRMLGEHLVLHGDHHAEADESLTFLELDPYYFWSGFARTRLARRLAQAALSPTQRQRARRYVLDCVDGTKHCGHSGVGSLAHSVADNALRRSLRTRLHSPEPRVASRAVRTLSRVAHPGLTPADLAAAREIVLADAARVPWLTPTVERLARWLWTPEWETELRDLTRYHGPDRAPAKKLLESMDRRRARQRAKRPGP